MKRYLGQHRGDEGFTLIELLIVIIILGILTAIVVFAVGTTGQNAKNASCSADAKSFENALEAYKADVGYYPGQTSATSTGTPNNGTLLTTTTVVAGQTVGPFLRELPGTTHYRIETDGQGGVFVYPPPPVPVNGSASGMDLQTVGGVSGATDSTAGDHLNFETYPGICSNADIVS